ncbi:MAG: tyrosine--tRNA ligase [Holosporaceae bacterium]|nr:tyrosine--tRNA ligase [Holosporaceae bacterium]
MTTVDVLMGGVAHCVTKVGLKRKLRSGKKLTVKLGFDPTAPDLHLGHAVVLNKLRQFQENGHKIVIVIGGFTAMIGDPTGRNKLRPPLSEMQIQLNAATYVNQLSKVLDINNIEVVNNVKWFADMTFSDLIGVLQKFTLSQIVQRNDFESKIANHKALYMHELVYPIMQAYDSYVIGADVELGGTDQLFNCLMGKDLQESFGQEGQSVLCMPILVGTDGKEKMGKSKGNYIGLTDSPNEMYGKIMSIPDTAIADYVSFASDFKEDVKNELIDELKRTDNCDFMKLKKLLAYNITARYHSAHDANEASVFFERVVQNRELLEEDYRIVTVKREEFERDNSGSLLDLCFYIYNNKKSRSSLKRMIIAGAMKVGNEKLLDPYYVVSTSCDLHLVVGGRDAFLVRFS